VPNPNEPPSGYQFIDVQLEMGISWKNSYELVRGYAKRKINSSTRNITINFITL